MNRIILFLIGIVLVGIAGFALVWFGVGRELQPVTAKFLVDMRDGKYRAVHETVHEELRARQSVQELAAYWEWWREEMGAFVEILRRRGVSTSTANGETRKGMTLDLGFMKGKARAHFEFLSAEPDPLLTHFRIYKLDEGAGAESDREQLVARVKTLFAFYDAKDWTGLYAALSSDLQKAWPQAKIAEQMPQRRDAFGAVKDLRLVRTEDGPEGVVIQHFEVDYEKAKGTAKVSQHFDDDRWHVVGFVLGDLR